jgi:hypothetical protein
MVSDLGVEVAGGGAAFPYVPAIVVEVLVTGPVEFWIWMIKGS